MTSKLLRLACTALVLFGIYHANVLLQTHLGKRVLAASELTVLPLSEALTQAKIDQKPILVNVSAIWCPGCRQLDKKVFADETFIKTMESKALFSRLEYESPEGEQFLKQHQLKGFPNLALVGSDGRFLGPIQKPYSVSNILAQLP